MKEGITREQMRLLYGIAILMMLFHHLFCSPARLNCEFISVLFGAETKIAWFCKLCVAIYAFFSGYGLYKKACADMGNVKDKLIYDYKLMRRQLLKFMKKYWIVFAIFVPIGFLTGTIKSFQPSVFLPSVLGLSKAYNREWWYARQYILMILLFPIIDVIFSCILNKRSEKFKIATAAVLVAAGAACCLPCFYNTFLGIFSKTVIP